MRTATITEDLKTNPPVPANTEALVEGLWKDVTSRSWMHANGNIAAMIYGMRSGIKGLPTDDDVYYVKVDGLGHLVHSSELEFKE